MVAVALWLREDLWIYVSAPVVGALAAVPLCRVLSMGSEWPHCDRVDDSRFALFLEPQGRYHAEHGDPGNERERPL